MTGDDESLHVLIKDNAIGDYGWHWVYRERWPSTTTPFPDTACMTPTMNNPACPNTVTTSAGSPMRSSQPAALTHGQRWGSHLSTKKEDDLIYAITTDNRTVALTEHDNVVDRLNSDTYLRDTVRCLRRGDAPVWDGVSLFTSRPATDAEQAAYRAWRASSG